MQTKEGKSDKNKVARKKAKPKEESTSVKQPPAKPVPVTKRPKPRYYFRCGEDGHIANGCSNPPDYALVSVKRKELNAKQEAWDKDNTASDLND